MDREARKDKGESSEPPSEHEFDEAFDKLMKLGYLTIAGIDEKGELQYRLTPEGERQCKTA